MVGLAKSIGLALTLFAFMVVWVSDAVAQDCQIATGPERQQEMRRVLEELNSVDPTVSIPTFEVVMQGCDAALRRLALRTALQSDDPVLQDLAVSGFLSGAASLVIQLQSPQETNTSTDTFMTLSGGRLEIIISNFDPVTGTFGTRIAGRSSDEETGRGAAVGRRISFDADARHIFGNAGTCRGVLSSGSSSAVLQGTLACERYIELIATINLLE